MLVSIFAVIAQKLLVGECVFADQQLPLWTTAVMYAIE